MRRASLATATLAIGLLVGLALPVAAGGNPTEHLLPPAETLPDGPASLPALEGLAEGVPGDEADASALERVGALLSAAGAALAEAAGAVLSAIGDGLAAAGRGLLAAVEAIGSALAWTGTTLWAGISAGAAGLWSGLRWTGEGLAWLAIHTGQGLAWLARATGEGLLALALGLVEGVSALVALWPEDPRDQAAAAAGVATATAAAGGAAWYTKPWRVLRYLPFLAPLYARIGREELLDHPARQEIHAAIQDSPGIHVSELSRSLGLPWGTLLHHVDKLERAGLVVSSAESGKRCFFLPGQVLREHRSILPALENGKARALAEYFAANPGASQKDAGQALGLSAALVSWHVKRLEEAGVLVRTRVGRRHEVGLTGEAMALVSA